MIGRVRCCPCVVAAILLSLCRAGRAEPLRPYTAFAWTAPTVPLPLPHVVGLVRYQASSDPAVIAVNLNDRPAGARALLRWESNDNHVWRNPLDRVAGATTRPVQGPWLANGAAAEGAFEGRFAADLRRRGATPDLLVLDTEMGVGTWNLSAADVAAVAADPRWPPLARRFGVKSSEHLAGTLDTAGSRAFNLAMAETEAGYFRAAFADPWRRAFPSIRVSEFGDGVLDDRAAADAPDDNGVVQPATAGTMRGDLQSPYCYPWVHGIGRPPANRGADFGRTLPVLCWLTGGVRAYARTPVAVLPWVSAKGWTDGHVGIRDTPWQDELLWHVCLSGGCTDVLLFNPDHRPADGAAADGDLATLQREAGDAATLRPLTAAAVPFDAAVLVSGAATPAGRRVYRVTTGDVGPRRVVVTLPGERGTTTVDVPAGACGAWVVR